MGLIFGDPKIFNIQNAYYILGRSVIRMDVQKLYSFGEWL